MNNLEINNPLNMRPSKPPWQGEIGERNGFAVFDTMPNGIRASMRQLLAYEERHGLNTIGEIVHRWAPPTENDTLNYQNYVCQVCELKPDDRINLRDKNTMFWLWTGMAEMEQGRKAIHAAITDADVEAGMEAAL